MCLACVGDRRVVLAEMHPVGAGRDSQVGAIVDDQQRSVLLARTLEPAGGSQDRVIGRILHPQLDDLDPAPQSRPQEPVGLLVADQVQVGGSETLAAVGHTPSLTRKAAPGAALGLTATGARPLG